MKFSKTAVLCSFLLVMAANISAQRTEVTVEQEYLSTVEDVIIKELAIAEDRDSKLVSLQYLETAIDSGRTSPDMLAALDLLAGEGVFSQARTNGRLANNFPDIRAKACDLLGKMKTDEAKDTLLKVTLADNEPMVTSSAIRALGEIGLNDDNEVVEAIAWAQKKYAVLNPTSSMALEILFAFEKLAPAVKDTNNICYCNKL